MERKNCRSPGLDATLAEIVAIASRLRDDWWIIGSAAIALLGIPVQVADVDLLVSECDARFLLSDWARSEHKPEDDDRFRSVFGHHEGTPLRIEVMGRLEVRTASGWVPVVPASRVSVDLPVGRVFVPDQREQIRLLCLFGRAKDLARAAILAAAPGT